MGGLVTSSWASGYAAVPKPAGPRAFTHIQDSFTIPRVNCAVAPNAVAQFRTGIDGISDDTIEHVGVSAICSGPAAAVAVRRQVAVLDPSALT